jgi:GTP cyclohydrolase II
MSSRGAVRLAIAMLRAGRPVRVTGAKELSVAAVETTSTGLLDLRDPDHEARLLISGQRAAALKLANERDAADPQAPVIIERAPWLDSPAALAIADSGQDLDRGPIGPLHPIADDCAEAAGAALVLARSAGLLPALWMLEADSSDACVSIEEIMLERRQPSVEIVARAKLPLENLPPTQIVAFRASDDGQEHVAHIIGAFGGKPNIFMIHS